MTPEDLQAKLHAAFAAAGAGDMEQAKVLASQVLAVAPNEPNASQVMAMYHLGQGKYGKAVPFLRTAELAAPDNPHILNLLGVAYKQSGKPIEARELFERSKVADAGFIDPCLNLADIAMDEIRLDDAKTEFDAVLLIKPNHPKALAGRARVALLTQDHAAATEFAERAITIQPDNTLAGLTLVVAKMRLKDFPAAKEIAQGIADHASTSPQNKALALGFVADADDRLGDYEAAFGGYTQANEILTHVFEVYRDAPLSPFSPEIISRLTDFVERDKDCLVPTCPAGERAPVFLMGFPRSGTTLLEQILLAHPKIVSLEEQITLGDAVEDLILADGGLDRLATLTADEAASYRLKYWARVAELGSAPALGEVFIDKLPLNTVLLPLIAKIFPNAKILFAIRDPRDVVLSCFQQRFGMNQAMYRLLSLDGAAVCYDQVMGLGMAAREAFDLDVHEIRYERMVENLETEVKATISFLGLEWDDAILDYREAAQAKVINTPSVAQVAEPIYTHAVKKWQNYAVHMAPLDALLAPWVKRFGFE